MDINKELAPLLGYERVYVKGGKVYGANYDEALSESLHTEIDYRDPSIFAECVKWLLDRNYVIGQDIINKAYFVQLNRNVDEFGYLLDDKDLFKAVALAVIQAKEG